MVMNLQDRAVLPEEMRHTYSVCPVCLKRVPAKREERDGQIYLVKTCPDHGTFSSVIWRNKRKFADWRGERPAVGENENLNCPAGCGLCAEHRRATCCTLLEITARCNMNCTFCFAEPDGAQDPSLDTVKRWIDDLTDPGKTLLQLSGGEPTVRDDLPEIVAYAKQVGCKYVQLNSNGLRLAEDEAFVKRLADAGLSFVFMQFDGVDDVVYEKLRRRPMLGVKKRAIEQCGRYGIGVTLVPVIVPGVNTEQIGDIIRFAIQRSPYVRGVHFQPVSYFGRIPELPADDDRYTLDELLEAVVSQSGGLIKEEQIAPSCCDHPMCGFHGDFIVMPGDKLMPLTNYSGKTETEPVVKAAAAVQIRRRRTVNLSDAAGNGAIWKRRAAVEKASRKKKAAAAMPMQMLICWRKHSQKKKAAAVEELNLNQNPAVVAELSQNQKIAAVAELSPNQNPVAVAELSLNRKIAAVKKSRLI